MPDFQKISGIAESGSLSHLSNKPRITVVILDMILARSKITSQGQISVPQDIRRKLGIGPGSVLEWEEEGEKIVIRRSGRFSSEDIHEAIFAGHEPKPRTLNELKEGIRQRARQHYAGR